MDLNSVNITATQVAKNYFSAEVPLICVIEG